MGKVSIFAYAGFILIDLIVACLYANNGNLKMAISHIAFLIPSILMIEFWRAQPEEDEDVYDR